MKLPMSWLKEFVKLDAELDEICHRLTMGGLEVENVEHLVPTFTEVYVAKVIVVEPHPNADRLKLCEVDAGAAGRHRVVCGAPNAHVGMTAALAKVGAKLAGGVHGEGSGRLADASPLQAATIRGVQSEGMLCSELELGLSDDHEGIIELSPDARVGDPLAAYLQIPDIVLDITITPNRGDCLSILGLAREIAALFGAKFTSPRVIPIKPRTKADDDDAVALAVDIQAPDLCPRYAALPMSGIAIGPSPVWLRRRLELCGMRAVNNIVDVTNYVMLETGQPLHAFDMERIAERAIVVRRAGGDREFDTLDGVNRNLDSDDLMIADREKPLAIAGIMGGRNSEVSPSTTAIVLESAYFEPMSIARTARRLGLRSEASYRFERGIDRAGQVNALARAAELIRKLSRAREMSPIIDVEPRPAPRREIELDLGSIESLLGVAVPAVEVKRRLKAVGMTIASSGRSQLRLIAPSFRPDLKEAADLAEEVARLPGLAEIPAVMPLKPVTIAASARERERIAAVRSVMIGSGLVEVRTIAFVPPADNERFAGLGGLAPLQVTNPLSAELSEMRRSLLPGLLSAMRFNLNREADAIHIFEVGKVFGTLDGNPTEGERLAGLSYGDYAMGAVGQPAIKASFSSLKGVVETCLRTFGILGQVRFEPRSDSSMSCLHPGRSAAIVLDGAQLGVLGEIHPSEALRLGVSDRCVLFELDSRQLLAYVSQPRPAVSSPPKFPAIRRDLALVVDGGVAAANVLGAVSESSSPLLESVELFDVYEGESIPSGKKSVALACRYRSKDRTLTDDEVNRAHAMVVEHAKTRLGAQLRQ